MKLSTFHYGPIAILSTLGFLTVAVSLGSVPAGGTLRILVYAASLLAGVLTTARLPLRGSLPPRATGEATALWLGALILVSADFLFVLGAQGWEWETGRWFSESYFRGAFLTDAERNHILVQSILRGNASPFLPEFPLRFQLAPFKLLAFFTVPGSPLSRYSEVQGISAALGLTLFALVLWWGIRMRPSRLRRPAIFLTIAVGVFCHADWWNLAWSFFRQGNWGIEADGSSAWFYYRYFSLKLMALLSPHHTLFCLFAGAFFLVRRFGVGRAGILGRLFFIALAAATSPPLALVLFSLVASADVLGRRRFAIPVWGAAFLLSLALSYLVLGFPPWEIFQRVSLRQWNWGFTRYWRLFPSVLLGSLGWLGFWITLGLFRARTYHRGNRVYFIFFLGAFGIAYLAGEGAEVQRHVSLLGSFAGALCIWTLIDTKNRRASVALALSVALAILANFVFVFRHTSLPSVLDRGIVWKDYFEMNAAIRESLPREPVLAAISQSRGSFPIVMEATTSFSMPMDVYIYHAIPEALLPWLRRVESELSVPPYAETLGYHYLLWGPAEERAWGERVRERFVANPALLRRGTVALYPLRDRYRSESKTPDLWAERLFNQGWNQEAYDLYASLHQKAPGDPRYLEKLARLWERAGNPAQAKIFQEKAENREGLLEHSTNAQTQAKVKK